MRETITHDSGWRRVYRRATDECEIPPLDIGIQAIQLSPYRAGVAGLCHTRLLTSPAFPSCSCPLSFQSQVRRVDSKSSALNFDPLRGQFTPCVPWRTVSVSRGSPATTPKQSLDDVQVGYGICASCAPHRDWSSGHLFPFPYSPTCHPVTRSVVSEPAAHITVRPCQAITAIPIGYYENSGTVSLSTCRPSRVPLQRNVLARRRCPIHVLQCSH
jgi:hypothetical protein